MTGEPYLGRYGGSPEGHAAGDYLAGQFAQYGLLPAGDDGTYFQPFPVIFSPLTEEPTLVISGPTGEVWDDFSLHQDYSPIVRMYAGEGAGEGPVVWANRCQPEDFVDADLTGAIVLCETDGFGNAPNLAGRFALENGAAGLLLLTDPAERDPTFGYTFREIWIPAPLPVLRIFPSTLDALLAGSEQSLETLQAAGAAVPLASRARLEVNLDETACPETGCQGRNVLGVLPGRDPAFTDQVVILGAHYDHLGEAPDGTIWAGANDNASGVAILLEIARSWHARGYIPRRTILFAAWDAEEQGLVGSRHYVQNPRVPLTQTVSMLQLDMVGAGPPTLAINGETQLTDHLLALAAAFDIPAESSSQGRSDHIPFLEAGVPAALMIYWDSELPNEHYHRPADVLAVIDPAQLAAVGRLTGISLVDLAESDPAIRHLLAARAAALTAGDEGAFLETTAPDQISTDQTWFADLQTFEPTDLSLEPLTLEVTGGTARGVVRLAFTYSDETGQTGERQATADLAVVFRRYPEGWRWAGPDLAWDNTLAQSSGEPPPELGPALAVAHPPEQVANWTELGFLAGEKYAALAAQLGLPVGPASALYLFPDSQSLRDSTALSQPDDLSAWVRPGELKLVYRENLTSSVTLDTNLAHLVLANAGVPELAAPWLWAGLPPAWQAEQDMVSTHRAYLPLLQEALQSNEQSLAPATAWAATD